MQIVSLITHINLLPRSKIFEAVPSLPHTYLRQIYPLLSTDVVTKVLVMSYLLRDVGWRQHEWTTWIENYENNSKTSITYVCIVNSDNAVDLLKKRYNCRSGRGKMQERSTENCHRYARTPSMILILHDLFVESAGIWPLEIQIFWDMLLHYWSSGSCCFKGRMFLQKLETTHLVTQHHRSRGNRYCRLLGSKQSAVSVWHMPVAVCTVFKS